MKSCEKLGDIKNTLNMEVARASSALQSLVDNPLSFLKEKAIQLWTGRIPPDYVAPGGATFRPGNAYLKLVETRTKGVYNLVFEPISTGSTDKNCILAIVLGAVENKRNDDVERVDIMRNTSTVKDKTFLFTVGLTGCSVVVTRVNNADTTYRVFHDRRVDSALLYNNVEMYVNFDDYRIGGQYLTDTGNAIVCMQFRDGVWRMYLQRQLPPSPTSPDPSKWEVYVDERNRGNITSVFLEKKFNDRRTILQNRIKSDAKLLKVNQSLIDGAKDGVYQGSGQYDDQAIRGWNELRTAIKSRIDEKGQKGEIKPDVLRKFRAKSAESASIDETWVWLQIKKKTGKGPNA